MLSESSRKTALSSSVLQMRAEECEIHTLSDVLVELRGDSFGQTKRTECDQTVARCLPPCHSSLLGIFVTNHHVPATYIRHTLVRISSHLST
jgi:hypothetical protein